MKIVSAVICAQPLNDHRYSKDFFLGNFAGIKEKPNDWNNAVTVANQIQCIS